MRTRGSNRRSSFGMKCVQCSNELIAPERSEYWSDKRACHIWYCRKCSCCFESARLVSCRHQLDEKFHDKGRWFPDAAGRIGQFKRSGSTTRHARRDTWFWSRR